MKFKIYCEKFLLLFLIYFSFIDLIFSLESKLVSGEKQVMAENIGVSQLLQMFFGLFLIIILILFLAWFVKKINYFKVGVDSAFKVISSLSVGQRERILLIQIGEKQLLIGVATGRVSKLLVLTENVVIEKSKLMESRISGKFSSVLNAVIKKS